MTMNVLLAQTALADAETPADLAVEVIAEPLRGMITLRADLTAASTGAALGSVFGLETPTVRRFTENGDVRALWMAPDEVMIHCEYQQAGAKTAELSEALSTEHHLAVNVSDMRQVITLRGAGARQVLAKGAPVDLHPDSFGVGDLRRTLVGTVAAAFYQISDAPETFEVFCFRSYAPYFYEWLCASAKNGALPDAF